MEIGMAHASERADSEYRDGQEDAVVDDLRDLGRRRDTADQSYRETAEFARKEARTAYLCLTDNFSSSGLTRVLGSATLGIKGMRICQQ